jgi:hypothetical protein
VLGRSLLVTSGPSSSVSRCSSSPAALRVKVITSRDSGAMPSAAIRRATRAATTRVLPLPGPVVTAAAQQTQGTAIEVVVSARDKVMTSSDSGATPNAVLCATRAATTRVLPGPVVTAAAQEAQGTATEVEASESGKVMTSSDSGATPNAIM